MSNSNQRFGVWDSFNDLALSLSPSLGAPEVCRNRGCGELVSAASWHQGYRMCYGCMAAAQRLSGRPSNDRREQNSYAFFQTTDNYGATEKQNEAAFKDALQRAEFAAQREEWLAAIPANWTVR